MPSERNGRYYIQRRFAGIGRVYKSLQTDRVGLARRREDALVSLYEQGRHEIVHAFDDGAVSIQEVHEAYEAGRVGELMNRLRRGSPSLADACEAALTDKKPDVKDSTYARYETGLEHFRTFCGDDMPVREALTTDRIQRFKIHRLDEDGVAEETVNNDLIAVSILATFAEGQGWIDQRPTIDKFKSTVRISYLESDALAAYMAELRPRFRPLMKLLVGTGMRLGDAIGKRRTDYEGLRVSDLRFGNGEARAEIRDAKTDSGVRNIFVPEWGVAAVKQHIREQGRGGRDLIFQIPRRTVQKEHDRARKRIGRPDYKIHDHKHTAAVHLARAGMPLHLLQQQLGHSTIDQTMRYARFHPEYGDMEPHFERAARSLGLGEPDDGTPDDALRQAADELGVDPGALQDVVARLGAMANNNPHNTPQNTKRGS